MVRYSKITAFFLSVLTGLTCLTGCHKKEESSPEKSSPNPKTNLSETQPQEETTPLAETEPPPTEHHSPAETLTIQTGTQKEFSGAVLNHETSKNYPISLSDLILPGDIVEKFVFEFKASDDIGTYQGGCGISLTEGCPSANSDHWYQSDDLVADADGSYLKLEWVVPPGVQNYIDANGKLQVGYWWGDTEEIELAYLTCCYTRTKEIPVDVTKNKNSGQQLNYESDKTAEIPLADILEEDAIPQAVTFRVHGDSDLKKITAGYRIKTTEDWYESKTVSQFSDSSQAELTWLIPDEIKENIPTDTTLAFDYFWSECKDITLDSVTVKYSIGNVSVTDNGEEIQVAHQNENAQKIVNEITAGWNLGNSLDCYNVTWSVTDFETAWNNPKTNKEMIEAIKKAGFNAIRIPVSWTDHMDEEGNIDTLWLKRVQQVVDYAMNNEMYTILNVHHDDYTWLTPTQDSEEAMYSHHDVHSGLCTAGCRLCHE